MPSSKMEPKVETQKKPINDNDYKELLTNKLDQLGLGGIFVWLICLQCTSPIIFDGFHIASYSFLGHLPDDQWCGITALQQTNWTVEQQKVITESDLDTKGCSVWDWDYQELSHLSYEDALKFTKEHTTPPSVSCKAHGNYEYADGKTTFVAEWDLVCDKSTHRTLAQMIISMGKMVGSFFFGVFADKYGRRNSFLYGSLIFVISGFICTFSPWYILFLVGRFGLGIGSTGFYNPSLTIIVENTCLKYRSWMSIAFAFAYPVGMMLLAIIAYLVQPWRALQLALTVPSILLLVDVYFMNESPRWLISKKRYDQTYKDLFKEKSPYELDKSQQLMDTKENKSQSNEGGIFKEFSILFGSFSMTRKLVACWFLLCATSLTYYVTVLNTENMHVNRYLFMVISALVDCPANIACIVMLRFIGRKTSSIICFWLTAVALLLILALSADNTVGVLVLAMIGRFGINANYGILGLYIAELFTTDIRNSALGSCSTWGHVGSVSAPYLVDVLGLINRFIPTTVCGIFVAVAGALTFTLPETRSEKLIDEQDADLKSKS